jgi:hypothetical protein
MRVKRFDQLGEVGKRSRQPVDFVDDDDVDLCPSSDDLRHIAGLQKGGSGSPVIEIMRPAS